MTKTEHLIEELNLTVKSGLDSMVFMVEKVAQETYRVYPK